MVLGCGGHLRAMGVKRGEREGVHKIYSKSGFLDLELTYKNNALDGVQKKYYLIDEVGKEALFENGRPVSGFEYDLEGEKKPMTDEELRYFIEYLLK